MYVSDRKDKKPSNGQSLIFKEALNIVEQMVQSKLLSLLNIYKAFL